MPTYAFAVPILPGKTETWLNYVGELKGPRREEWIQSRQNVGLSTEQVWLQRTPQGDFAVIRLEGDDPAGGTQKLMESNEPFDRWFREKIVIECHGLNQAGDMPQPNEMVLDYTGQPTGEKVYSGSRKR